MAMLYELLCRLHCDGGDRPAGYWRVVFDGWVEEAYVHGCLGVRCALRARSSLFARRAREPGVRAAPGVRYAGVRAAPGVGRWALIIFRRGALGCSRCAAT